MGAYTLTHRETVKEGLVLLRGIAELARDADFLVSGVPVVQKSFQHPAEIDSYERAVNRLGAKARGLLPAEPRSPGRPGGGC